MKVETVSNYVEEHINAPKHSETLKGLLSAHIGMIIAKPSIGKSHLALSIAIENASSIKLIGLSASAIPKKTLYVSAEDVSDIVAKRLQDKIRDLKLSPEQLFELNQHLDIASENIEPLVISPDASMQDKLNHERYLEEVSAIFGHYSLVIIDTISRAAPTCDLVTHDRHITNVFDKLAKQSKASILLIHHVTKNHVHNREGGFLSMASGLGLSSLMGYSRFIYGVEEVKEKLLLSPLKLNYVENPKPIYLSRSHSLTVAVDENGELLSDALGQLDSEPDKEMFMDNQKSEQIDDSSSPAISSKDKAASSDKRSRTRQQKMVEEPKHIVMSTKSAPQQSKYKKFKHTL